MSGAWPRSWLFVPGDSERKQAKALGNAADALILDLEDSVAAAQLPAARRRVAQVLGEPRKRAAQQLWVRVNPPSTAEFERDLAAIVPAKPDGLVLPKVSSAQEIHDICQRLAGSAPMRLMVIATETPKALLTLGQWDLLPVAAHLAALTWGMEDLATALGATAKRDASGALTATFQHARTMCLLAAAAAGVQAVDSIFADFRDAAALAREAEQACADGFTGKLAIHPDQVETINAAFSPTPRQIEWAMRVIAAFQASAQTGVTSLDGQMLDRPHLVQAQRLMETVQRSEQLP